MIFYNKCILKYNICPDNTYYTLLKPNAEGELN